MKKEQEEKKTVFLPAELYGKVEERVRATDFGSVDEYVEFVMEEVVKEEEEERAFSEEEEKEDKKRLKDLGYLDKRRKNGDNADFICRNSHYRSSL